MLVRDLRTPGVVRARTRRLLLSTRTAAREAQGLPIRYWHTCLDLPARRSKTPSSILVKMVNPLGPMSACATWVTCSHEAWVVSNCRPIASQSTARPRCASSAWVCRRCRSPFTYRTPMWSQTHRRLKTNMGSRAEKSVHQKSECGEKAVWHCSEVSGVNPCDQTIP